MQIRTPLSKPKLGSSGALAASTTTRIAESRVVCLLFAVGFILLLFGDVIFLGTSLAPVDYDEVLSLSGSPSPPRSIFPERKGRSVLDGQGDTGGGAYQMEPALKFMAFCMRTGESPFWDPYTATGALGPETLADIKFSPLTLITALLGGSSRTLSFVLLGLYVISSYCILRLFTTYLGLSLQAALAACAVFFLNGFALGNLYLPIGQPYFLAPILLISMLAFTGRQTPQNAVFAIGAHLLLVSTTLIPTAVLSALVVYSITLSLRWFQSPNRRWRILAIHAGVPSVTLLLLGFMYFPIFDAFATYLNTVKQYNQRLTPGISLINLLSLFTPKHFWESYRAMRLPVTAPPSPYEMFTHHMGIIGPLIAVHAISRLSKQTAPVVLAAITCVSVAVGQIFGIVPFTFIDSLPFFSFVQNDYWACMVALGLAVLVAYGYEAICATNAFTFPCLFLISVITASFFFLYGHLGLYGRFETVTDVWTKRYVVIFWVVLLGCCLLLALSRIVRLTHWTKLLLLLGLVSEGLFYMNGLRPHRSDKDGLPPKSILWVKSAVDRHPGSRILNVGRSGLFPNWGSALQIPELGDLNTADFPWYAEFFEKYIGSGLFLSLGSGVPTGTGYSFTDASLSLAGVRYVIVDRRFEPAIRRLSGLGYGVVQEDRIRLIFENPHPMPRSFIVRELRTLDGLPSDVGLDASRLATTTDKQLLFEAKKLGLSIDIPENTASQQPGASDTVEIGEYHHDRVQVKCNLRQAGLVVMADSWSPRWRASVDRKPVYIGRADVAFRAIAVPAGQHDIEFRYYPFSRLLGQVVSGLTLLGLGIALWIWRDRGRRTIRSYSPAGNKRSKHAKG